MGDRRASRSSPRVGRQRGARGICGTECHLPGRGPRARRLGSPRGARSVGGDGVLATGAQSPTASARRGSDDLARPHHESARDEDTPILLFAPSLPTSPDAHSRSRAARSGAGRAIARRTRGMPRAQAGRRATPSLRDGPGRSTRPARQPRVNPHADGSVAGDDAASVGSPPVAQRSPPEQTVLVLVQSVK